MNVVEQERESARESNGQFGVQERSDAGIVQVPEGASDEDVEAVLYAMEYVNMAGDDLDGEDGGGDSIALDDFGGYDGDTYEQEVEQVAAGIMAVEGGAHPRPMQFVIVPDRTGGTEMIQVGAIDRKTGLTAIWWENWGDLTDDNRATGRDAARAIARGLLRVRDVNLAKLDEHLGPVA